MAIVASWRLDPGRLFGGICVVIVATINIARGRIMSWT